MSFVKTNVKFSVVLCDIDWTFCIGIYHYVVQIKFYCFLRSTYFYLSYGTLFSRFLLHSFEISTCNFAYMNLS